MKRCPKCGEEKFYVTSHVVQEWLVDKAGSYLETTEDCIETTHISTDEDLWRCANCGYEAAGKEFNQPIYRAYWNDGCECDAEEAETFEEAKAKVLNGIKDYIKEYASLCDQEWNDIIENSLFGVEKLIGNGDYEFCWHPSDVELKELGWVKREVKQEIRIKVDQTYTAGNDATIIWEWIYKGEDLIRERIVGYYHGKPNKEDMKECAFRGVEGILDLDDDEIYEN